MNYPIWFNWMYTDTWKDDCPYSLVEFVISDGKKVAYMFGDENKIITKIILNYKSKVVRKNDV